MFTFTTTENWKPIELATLLRFLQPVESEWKQLARLLLRDELSYKIDTIEADCFHNTASKTALIDVLSKWLEITESQRRTWKTLCDTAKKYGDESLEKYIQENNLKVSFLFILW